jgi:hypothetical protein
MSSGFSILPLLLATRKSILARLCSIFSGAVTVSHIFFVPMTVARFDRSGAIAQLIIDHVLGRGFVVSSCRQDSHH